MKSTYFLFDFDSTFTQVEAMEELAEISLANDPEKEVLIEKIKQLTDLAMDGSMPFGKSLKARIALLSARKYHVSMLVNRLRKRVSPSFARNKQFFKDYKGKIIIISGGFREFIEPVVKPFFIEPSQVYANTFVYDKKNNIIGADESNVLAQENGKVKLLKQLKLQGNVIVVGDGFTDWQVYEAGLATQFYAYTENISRHKVLERSEFVAPSLDEILYTQKLPMSLSYPKSRIRAILYGESTFLAEPKLKEEGYQIIKLPAKVGKTQLNKELQECNLLLFEPSLESKLPVKAPSRLLTAAYWGEPENPDSQLAEPWSKSAVALFGNQYAHTRSIAELVIRMLLQLNRYRGEELPGKKLGIIGYGNCGAQLSVICADLGMEVYFYDTEDRLPLGNAKRVKEMSELLRKCDLVVLTLGRRFGSATYIGARELRMMPQGSILINLSRDESIDITACKNALVSGKLGGLGIDRVKKETGNEIAHLPNVLITDNERLKTRQTQQNMANLLSEKLINFINNGATQGSLNFPQLSVPALMQSHRLIHVHRNEPGVLAQINGILGRYEINISGQYLKTNRYIGYVITDIGKGYSEELLAELKGIAQTIRFRVLY